MQKYCDNCGKPFLTEADLFVYQNTNKGEYYSCGCKEGIALPNFLIRRSAESHNYLVEETEDDEIVYLWGEKLDAKRFFLSDALAVARLLAFSTEILTECISQYDYGK